MNREEMIGKEVTRHNKSMADINKFYDFLSSCGVKEKKYFPYPLSGSEMVWCLEIEHRNLRILFTWKEPVGKVILHEWEVFDLTVDQM